ncbi:MAG TPA: GIY-YIG nuclease family protein [Candidatus Paceibacterota bacterium]|nr:GIY-YIG nuclease family protein [Candidatus Paceibacterota bacterium]
MPYSNDCMGIYSITNTVTGDYYVGQSVRVRKRIADHLNLLGRGVHPNPRLQNAFHKYGTGAFRTEIEVECEGVEDLNSFENAFLSGEAYLGDRPVVYNIAREAVAPLRGRTHPEEVKERISRSRAAAERLRSPESKEVHRKKLLAINLNKLMADEKRLAEVRYILENEHLTYAERARHLNKDITTVRDKYLRWRKHRGVILDG